QHVERRAKFAHRHASDFTNHGLSSIGGHRERAPQLMLASVAIPIPDASDSLALTDEVEDLALHQQTEMGIALSLFREEVQEVPLGRDRDVRVLERQLGQRANLQIL